MKTFGFCIKILLLLLVSGCGGPATQEQGTVATDAKKSQTAPVFAIQTAQTVTPKDTETPAEQGGYGFEQIAAAQGFVTSAPTPEEIKYFGDPRATKGGEIKRIMPRFPATMRATGQLSNYLENYMFCGMIYESLLEAHPVTQEYMPGLASHWKVSDDKMTFWFRLNPDARWSDGMPVIADDVVATWDLRMDETILFPSSMLTYGKLERPVAESKYIVRVKAKELNWRNMLYFSGMLIFPHHILKDLNGTQYLQQYQFKMLPGTGPYTMLESDIQIQQSYALTRRLDYWGANDPVRKYVYNFDKIHFQVVKDNPALEFEKVKKGEQDFFFERRPQRWAEESNFDAVQKGWVQKREIYTQKPTTKYGLTFNMRKPPFNDKRVRYAIGYLIDREKMNKELFFGLLTPQNSDYSGTIYENPANEQIAFDPDKAMQLLAEAGWKNRNAEGFLVNAKGQPFKLEIGIAKADELHVGPMQQMLRQYGIDLEMKFLDDNTRWKIMMDRSFEVTYVRWGGILPPNPETSYHSRLANKEDNNNVSGFANPRVDALCAQYDVEFSTKKRIEIIQEIDKIVSEERPTFMTFYQATDWLLYWDRYSYPEYVVDRYLQDGVDNWAVLKYWWFDPAKAQRLQEAIAKNDSLPVGELKATYWRDFAAKEKNISDVKQ